MYQVFYSCPHFGSKLADMPWRMGLVLRPAPTVSELLQYLFGLKLDSCRANALYKIAS